MGLIAEAPRGPALRLGGRRIETEEPPVAVACDRYNEVCVVAVVGDLGGDDAAALYRAVDDAVRRDEATEFVINLADCEFIDGPGLEALLRARRRCDAAGGRLELAGLDENCRRILAVTRLDECFQCHGELAGALKPVR